MTDSAVCLVTGATSGIGRATAQALASMGRSVVILGRNPTALEDVSAQIRASTGNDAVEVLHADLASLESVRGAADRFLAGHDRLDVLVNNAGVMLMHRSVTADGFETTFAVNHLAPFLLTNLLFGVLKQSAPSRVVNLTSTGFRRGRIDLGDLQAPQRSRGCRPTTTPSSPACCSPTSWRVAWRDRRDRQLRAPGGGAHQHRAWGAPAAGLAGAGRVEPAVHAHAGGGRAHERVGGHGGRAGRRLGPVLRQRA